MPHAPSTPAHVPRNAKTSQPMTLPEVGRVRLPTVLAVLHIGRSTWYNLISQNKAPRPVHLGGAATWSASEIRRIAETGRYESAA